MRICYKAASCRSPSSCISMSHFDATASAEPFTWPIDRSYRRSCRQRETLLGEKIGKSFLIERDFFFQQNCCWKNFYKFQRGRHVAIPRLQSVRMSLEIFVATPDAFKLVTLRAVGFSSRTSFLWKILRKVVNITRVDI